MWATENSNTYKKRQEKQKYIEGNEKVRDGIKIKGEKITRFCI